MEWLGFLNVNSFMPEYRAGKYAGVRQPRREPSMANLAMNARALSSLVGVFEAFLQLHWTWVQPFFGFVYRPAFMSQCSLYARHIGRPSLTAAYLAQGRW